MFEKFWIEFLIHETTITDLLNKRNSKDYNTAMALINSLLQMFRLNNSVSIILGIDIRNGTQLPERYGYFELIISPMFQKKNIEYVDKLVMASKSIKLSTKITIIKYKFFKYLDNKIKLVYDKIEITNDDLSFLVVDKTDNKLSFIIFINDDKINLLTTKTDINGTDMYIPNDNGITSILDSIIGEYSMLYNIEFMEIECKGLLDSDKFKNIKQHVLHIDKLFEEVKTLNNDKKNCVRCLYSNTNINLLKCKKTGNYYCDKICQREYTKGITK